MSTADEAWRLFVAIELPAKKLRGTLKNHVNQLRQAVPDARASWIREDNLHLTLKFLGETPLAKIEQLSSAAQRAANAVGPFEINIGSCGAFPPNGQPRV